MHSIRSVLIKDYKNFKNDYIGFNDIKLLNLVIGRNNTGKSSLLDMFNFLTDVKQFSEHQFVDNIKKFDSVVVGYIMDELLIKKIFSSSSGITINGKYHRDSYKYGQKYLNTTFFVKISIDKSMGGGRFKSDSYDELNLEYGELPVQYRKLLAQEIKNPLASFKFVRLSADRNILPEKESKSLNLLSDGSGATNLIHRYINLSTLDSKLVEKNLLNTLNEIMKDDAFFTDIVVQQIEIDGDTLWEIFLEEELKGRIPLSKSGSGLKTIILVLLNIFLVPVTLNAKLSKTIFVFEELENNLHPALQRRLFNYLKDWSIMNKVTVFFTTHSNIPINLFSSDKNSKIVHLTSNSNGTSSVTSESYQDHFRVLDDLDVRASDIFQSNGVIWVEGPSDRIYLKKWIDLYSNHQLIEGVHYQIIFYGGRLLSHLNLEDPSQETELINLLLTNRNAAILIDSDKKNRSSQINNTKKRIREEFSKNNSFFWITRGKEIENYLSKDMILKYYFSDYKENISIKEFEQYQRIDDFLDTIEENAGKKFLRNKIKFAHALTINANKNDFENILDLDIKMKELIKEIKKWNSIEYN